MCVGRQGVARLWLCLNRIDRKVSVVRTAELIKGLLINQDFELFTSINDKLAKWITVFTNSSVKPAAATLKVHCAVFDH